MRQWPLGLGIGLAALLAGPVIPLAAQPPHAEAKLTDEELQDRARTALEGKDPAAQREVLRLLSTHRWKGLKSPAREYGLYAQGLLEERLGSLAKAVPVLRKLELGFPKSLLLPEAQVLLAEDALAQRRFKDAELRLSKALAAELPILGKRRAQDLMLWTLAEAGKAAEGLAIAQGLQPQGTRKPDERGLAGLAIVLCHGTDRAQADQAVKDFQRQFKTGALLPKVLLAWGRFTGASGTQGDDRLSAEALRKVIRIAPKSAEADEARLALATLLSEGRLSGRFTRNLPDPATLLKDLNQKELEGPAARQREFVRMRLALRDGKWRQALELGRGIAGAKPTDTEQTQLQVLRGEAMQGWAKEALGTRRSGQLLPHLDTHTLGALAPDTRLALVKELATSGLPGAARQVIDRAPESERAALGAAALQATEARLHPDEALALVPSRGADAAARLKQAQALAGKGDWKGLRGALPGALPGVERIRLVLALLRRPLDKDETPPARRREAEGWLTRARERGAEREPLAVLVADLRALGGDWRGALALYPEKAAHSPGWVALQRATALVRTRQKARARTLLEAAAGHPDFKAERDTLLQSLGAP